MCSPSACGSSHFLQTQGTGPKDSCANWTWSRCVISLPLTVPLDNATDMALDGTGDGEVAYLEGITGQALRPRVGDASTL